MSDEEKAYAEKMDDLSLKTSTMNAALEGIADTIPGYKVSKSLFLTEDTREELTKERENMLVQNLGAYTAGNVAGSLYNYPLVTNALQAMGVGALTDKAGNAVGQAAGKIGQKAAKPVANAVSNILADTSADVVMDTIPTMAEDIRNGSSAGEVAANAAANVGTNLGLNVLGEGIQNIPVLKDYLAKKLGSKAAGNQTVDKVVQLEEVENAFKSSDVGLTHTPDQLKQMRDYYNSVDEGIIDFVQKVRNNEYVKPVEVATISDKAA